MQAPKTETEAHLAGKVATSNGIVAGDRMTVVGQQKLEGMMQKAATIFKATVVILINRIIIVVVIIIIIIIDKYPLWMVKIAIKEIGTAPSSSRRLELRTLRP